MKLSDVIAITTDTLTGLLLGEQNLSATSMAPPDKPLLQKGTYESVVVSSDREGFAHLSKGALSVSDIGDIEQKVVSDLNNRLKRRGYMATSAGYPATVTTDKTLLATLTPQTQVGGSEEDQTKGRGRTLILVRVTVTDPKTATILAQRDYYSGTDARRPGESSNRRNNPDRR